MARFVSDNSLANEAQRIWEKMMRASHRLMAAAFLTAALAGILWVPARAEEEKDKAKEAPKELTEQEKISYGQIVRNLMMVEDLKAMGYNEKARKIENPAALLTAASLLLKVQKQTGGSLEEAKITFEAVDEKGNKLPGTAPKEEKKEKEKSFEEQAEYLFDIVRGTDLPGVETWIKTVKADAMSARAVVGGPSRNINTLPPGGIRSGVFSAFANRVINISLQCSQPVHFRIQRQGGPILYDDFMQAKSFSFAPPGQPGTFVPLVLTIRALKTPTNFNLYVY